MKYAGHSTKDVLVKKPSKINDSSGKGSEKFKVQIPKVPNYGCSTIYIDKKDEGIGI